MKSLKESGRIVHRNSCTNDRMADYQDAGFLHLAMRRERGIAKVAMARKLAVRLYWMWRKEWDYEEVRRFGSHAGQPENPLGVQ